MDKKEIEKFKAEEWRRGYDLGVKNSLASNNEAIKIGQAILDVLDNRYEFKEEDY